MGFLGRLPVGAQPIPAMTACVRIDFTNFDLEPPSVEFINPFTGEYAPPPVQALVDTEEGPRDLVVHSHPDTNRPFFCVRGIRQYHEHPQHSGTSGSSTATAAREAWRRSATASGARWRGTCSGSTSRSRRCQGSCSSSCVSRTRQARSCHREQAEQAHQAARAAQPGLIVALGEVPPQMLAALGLATPPEGPQGQRAEREGAPLPEFDNLRGGVADGRDTSPNRPSGPRFRQSRQHGLCDTRKPAWLRERRSPPGEG